ncbi:hypothetical protein B0A48_18010 [Cryoendolithus antarcticus]|uniref:Kinetochore-associated protein MTW1 n=1 Tax=Cryoendolithus antarcticus TaxID=1507870 RepID=A0A1V8SAE8_9PEZI|nr:hypothetical protein B0A48_18010 [Cryoendolithus antarcticus]
MAATSQETTALLTEHFRYTPLTLLDDVINTVNELVFRAINAIESGFQHASPESLGFRSPPSEVLTPEASQDILLEQKQTEVDSGIIKLESLLNAIVDKDFDKFEIYTLRNILAIGHEEDGDLARWVQLEHYRHLDLQADSKASGLTPEALQLQRRKVQETAKLNAMLKVEEASNAAVLAQLKQLLGQSETAVTQQPEEAPYAFLSQSQHTSTASQPLTENLQYLATQLPVLRQLLSQLKEALATLPDARQARQDQDSAETRRARYLDAQARRALQRRGLGDTAEQGTKIEGRKIGVDELSALEGLVQALGGADRQHAGSRMDET